MLLWYIAFRKLMRDIERKSRDALALYEQGGKEASKAVNDYLKSDYEKLTELWRQQFTGFLPSNLGRHIHFGMDQDYADILKHDLPDIEAAAEKKILEAGAAQTPLGFESLLHPIIAQSSLDLLKNGHLREAVLNAIVAVFDRIRQLTGIAADGDALIGKAFSIGDPYIVLSELDSESGQNDQKGFMQIYKGAYQGIRNPKSHTLMHDLTREKASQYLIFASLLARRLDEAKILKKDGTSGVKQPVQAKKPQTSKSA